jgi:hypothetical protein
MVRFLMVLVVSFILVICGVMFINTTKLAQCAGCINLGEPCISSGQCFGVGCKCYKQMGSGVCAPSE